jgi:hypothetical protein
VTLPGCPDPVLLEARHDGEVDEATRRQVDAHLDGCPACARASRRLAGLSSLLRAWEAEEGRPEAPARLFSRTLAEVSSEAFVRRRGRARERARGMAAAAAVVLLVGGSALVAARAPLSSGSPASPSASGAVVAETSPRPAPIAAARRGDGATGVPERSLSSAAADLLRHGAAAPDLTPLEDEEARRAFARYAALDDLRRRLGDDPVMREEGPVARFAVVAFDRWRERARALRAGRATPATPEASTVTVPSTPGATLAAAAAFPLVEPWSADGSVGFAEVEEWLEARPARPAVADPLGASVVVRAIPARSASSDVGPPASAFPIDLPAAVATGRVSLLEEEGRLDALVAIVRSDRPVLVLAGELLTGGPVDRAVVRTAWLRASDVPYRERIACVPIARGERRAGGRPVPTGLVAGPSIRALLAREAPVEEVLEEAARLARRGGAREGAGGGLVDALRTRETFSAIAALAALPEGASGFVASDADGRFGGLETTGLPAPLGTAVLRRLLAGYVGEAALRPGDVGRLGPRTDAALLSLAHRAPTLVARGLGAYAAEVPITGLRLSAAADGDAVAHASALPPSSE